MKSKLVFYYPEFNRYFYSSHQMVINYIKDFLSDFSPAWLSYDEWCEADMISQQ